MNIVILPLLVISQLNIGTDLWRYGPEITYNVCYHANTTLKSSDETFKNRIMTYKMTTELKCRPRTPKILNCYLEQPKVHLGFKNESSSLHHEVHPEEPGDDYLHNQNFEIRFNRFGIKELIVPSTIRPFILDTIRAIVNQLHVGVDLTVRTNGTYKTWENFTTGGCFTTYDIKMLGVNLGKNEDGEGVKWRPDVSTVIRKIRDMKKCRIAAPYFLGSRESWRDNPQVVINVKSSNSLITANKTAFISSTQTSVEMENPRKKPPISTVAMKEIMTMTYASVKPAINEISKIENPASASIITGKWLHDDFSVENDVDEEKEMNYTSKSLASLIFNFGN